MMVVVSATLSQTLASEDVMASLETGFQSNLSDSTNPTTAENDIGLAGSLITIPITVLVLPNQYYSLIDVFNTNDTSIQAWDEYLNPSCGTKVSTTFGTYNQTLANNVPININGNRINFINGTNNPIHVVNSNSGQQVNVTISSPGSGVTQLNGFMGKVNITRTYSNNTEIINSTGNIKISVKPNVVLTNGSKQIFTKSLDLGGPTNNQDIFDDMGILIRNPLHSQAYTINAGAITQNVTLSLPITNSSTDTIAVLKTPQTFTAPIQFTVNATRAGMNFGSLNGNPTNLKNGDCWYTTVSNNLACRINGISTVMAGTNLAQTYTMQNIFSNNQTIASGNDLIMGTANRTTTAIHGFLYIPVMKGLPTGVPSTHTGTVPEVYDGTDNKLCIYNGGWKCITLS